MINGPSSCSHTLEKSFDVPKCKDDDQCPEGQVWNLITQKCEKGNGGNGRLTYSDRVKLVINDFDKTLEALNHH